jgi:hypothetical protein
METSMLSKSLPLSYFLGLFKKLGGFIASSLFLSYLFPVAFNYSSILNFSYIS